MLTAIVVDDEENNREMLVTMLNSFFPGRINVLARCGSVASALTAISTHHPDVVFLDIEMPNENSFSLIEKTLDEKYQIVFVTAYSQYAAEAFKVNAIDYILKPLRREDLGRAIERLERNHRQVGAQGREELLQKILSLTSKAQPKLGLPSLKGTVFIDLNELIRCEAEGSYSVFYLSGQKVMISRGLKEVEEILKPYNFLRVHKSHIVNLDKVVRYSRTDGGSLFMQDDSEVPVSRTSKEELEKRLVIL